MGLICSTVGRMVWASTEPKCTQSPCVVQIFIHDISKHIYTLSFPAVWWSEFTRDRIFFRSPRLKRATTTRSPGTSPLGAPRQGPNSLVPGWSRLDLDAQNMKKHMLGGVMFTLKMSSFGVNHGCYCCFLLFWGRAPQNLLLYREGNMEWFNLTS